MYKNLMLVLEDLSMRGSRSTAKLPTEFDGVSKKKSKNRGEECR